MIYVRVRCMKYEKLKLHRYLASLEWPWESLCACIKTTHPPEQSYTFQVKLKRFKKMAWIQSHLHLQWKFKLLAGKFTWGNKAKNCNKPFVCKSLLTMPSNVLPLHLKHTFPPLIWIFTEGEGDGIESSLPS